MQFRLEPLTRFIKGSIIYHRDFWLVRSRVAFPSVGTLSPTLSTPPLPVAHPWVATFIQLKDDFLRAYLLISIPFGNTQGLIFNYTTSCHTPARGSSREFQSRRRVSFHLSVSPLLSYLNQGDSEAIALVASDRWVSLGH